VTGIYRIQREAHYYHTAKGLSRLLSKPKNNQYSFMKGDMITATGDQTLRPISTSITNSCIYTAIRTLCQQRFGRSSLD